MKTFVALLAVALMAAPTVSLAAMAGANTVNSAAIVDGSIATVDIANKAVTAAKIADSTITATQLAAGAVTDAKISGPISVAKLPVGTTATTVAAGNHTHDLSGYSKKYGNVVVVAKSGGDFSDPIAAVNSITNASAASPWLVKIMPGVYNLGTASLQMKPYVDIDGSGMNNTVISSSVLDVDNESCVNGTLKMANNSMISRVKVVNMRPAGSDTGVDAIIINNVTARAEEVSVLVNSTSAIGTWYRNNGFCIAGPQAAATLNNVTIETHNLEGQSNSIYLNQGASLNLTNSTLKSFGEEGGDVINSGGWDGVSTPGIVNITNTSIEGTNYTTNWYDGIFLDGYKTTIANSTLNLNTGVNSSTEAFWISSDFTMTNTKVTCDGGLYYSFNSAKVKIANSLLQGDVSSIAGATLFNNYDENFKPIPNQ